MLKGEPQQAEVDPSSCCCVTWKIVVNWEEGRERRKGEERKKGEEERRE